MNNGSGSMSDSPSVVMPCVHTVTLSIHQLLLVGTGEEAEVDGVAGWALRMRSVSHKRLVAVQRRWNDAGYWKAYKQRDCRVVDLSYRPGSPYCTPMDCTVEIGLKRTAEGCKLTGAEVNSGVGAAVDNLTVLDRT